LDDSILSESAGLRGAEGAGGAMEGSDLGSTVAAIMHHAPVLRSRHVAVREKTNIFAKSFMFRWILVYSLTHPNSFLLMRSLSRTLFVELRYHKLVT
jgi:hypothetical protein